MSYINTVTGIAEGVLGDVGQWRKVIENNPSELFGKLPPTLQTDINKYYKSVKLIGDKLNIKGLNLPDAEASTVMGKIFQGRLGGVSVSGQLSRVAIELESLKGSKGVNDVKDILKQVDWLL